MEFKRMITINYNELEKEYNKEYQEDFDKLDLTSFIPECEHYNFIYRPSYVEIEETKANIIEFGEDENESEILEELLIKLRIFNLLRKNGIFDDEILIEVDY